MTRPTLLACILSLSACGGGPSNSKPAAHDWQPGLYRAESDGSAVHIFVSGTEVSSGVPLDAWQYIRGTVSGSWYLTGERPTEYGPLSIGITSGYKVRLEIRGRVRIITAKPVGNNS